jgi:nucleoside-diphosphate-sugar epimerase
MKRILVNGAGGFIGGHLVKRLKAEGNWVRAVDLKPHEYATPPADEFIVGDLRDQALAAEAVEGIEEIYQLAADMGGAGQGRSAEVLLFVLGMHLSGIQPDGR